MILRRIDPVSLAKVFGIVYGLLGLVAGALISVFAIGGTLATAKGATDGFLGFAVGAGAIIVVPILYGALGFLFGLLGGFFYNFAARTTGGLVLEFEQKPAA